MEANIPPVIIPVWLTGFDQVMPEGRPFPYKYLPHLGAHLSITFGEPLSAEYTRDVFSLARKMKNDHSDRQAEEDMERSTGYGNSVNLISSKELDQIRSEITEAIQHAVLALGRKVSGAMLSVHQSM